MKHPYDLVLVLWDDPGEMGLGWQEDKDVTPKPMLARNVGWLVKKDRTYLVLSGSIADPETTDRMSHHAHFQIGRSLVRKLEVLAKKGTELGGQDSR